MSNTTFPQITETPQLAVSLPVGQHLFRLVVTDECGVESAPDLVKITVEKKNEQPIITYIDPAEGQRGKTCEAVIIGANLQAVKTIKVFSDHHEDRRVSVAFRPGGTAERLPVTIKIFEHAPVGPRTIEVTTAHGLATVPFTVVPAEGPRIIDITPTWGALGLTKPLPARIEGDHLESAKKVTFLFAGQPDETVITTIRQAHREFLDLEIEIDLEAPLGRRTFTVTTAAGTVTNPLNVVFQVVPGFAQIGIMALTTVTALIHLALQFPSALFMLNGLGYLALLTALYLPVRQLRGWRTSVRWGLLGYTLITLIAWLVMGDKQAVLAYFTKAVELALIGLLLVENYQDTRKR